MKLKTSYIFYVCLSSLIIVIHACTIEKRVYQKGFHISWKDKNLQIYKNKEQLETDTNASKITEQEYINSIIETKNLSSDISINEDLDNHSSFQSEVNVIEEKTMSPLNSNSVKNNEEDDEKKENTSKTEPFGVIAMILSFILLFTPGKFYTFFVFLPIIAFILIAILLLIHRSRLKKFPDKYKNKSPSFGQQKEIEWDSSYDSRADILFFLGIAFYIIGLLATFIISIFMITTLSLLIIAGVSVLLSWILLFIHKKINQNNFSNTKTITTVSLLAVVFLLLFLTQSGFILLLLLLWLVVFLLYKFFRLGL